MSSLRRSLVAAQVALYRALILVLPGWFRRSAGGEMVDVFRAHLVRRTGAVHTLRVWGVALADLLDTSVAVRSRKAPDRVGDASDDGMKRGLGTMIDQLRQDVHFAIRTFSRQPGMILAAVLTLALGIGGSTAIFSVVKGVLVNTLPYPDAHEVVYVTETDARGRQGRTSYENLRDWQTNTTAFEALTVWISNSTNVTGEGQPERIRGMFVTASYFDVIGIHPVLGRAIAPGEDEPGGPRTTVLSSGFWQRRYGADPDVLGRTLVLNNVPHEIVGVMPAGLKPPWGPTDAWISLPTLTGWTLNRESKSFPVMARLRSGVSIARAQEDLAAVQAGLREAYPEANRERGVLVQGLAPLMRESLGPTLMILLVAAGLVLLIGCANVANLQMARSVDRVREVGIRAALGGGRRRIVTQLLTENLLLAVLGGGAGVALSFWGVRLLVALRPAYADYYHVGVDGAVLTAGMALALITGLLFGTAPALRASRLDLTTALREGRRGSSATGHARAQHSALVVAQTAVTVTLLVGSGLLVRSVAAVEAVDPGFETEGLLTFEFRLPPNKYETVESRVAFFDQVLERARAIPGMSEVASAGSLPFSGNGGMQEVFRPDQERVRNGGVVVQTNAVSPSYLSAMRIRLLAGRNLAATDRLDTRHVAVVSRDLAERMWPGEDPIGQELFLGGEAETVQIVGVAGEVRVELDAEVMPHVYLAYTQRPTLLASLAVRAGPNPLTLTDAVREAIWAVDPDQPVWEIMFIGDRIARTVQGRRFLMVLLAVFAVMALAMGSVGIYGVMSYGVRRRTLEIGVRMAFGARNREIQTMVLKQGLFMILLGVVLGLVGAASLSRVLSASLFAVSPYDPATFAVVPIVLVVVATVACYLPARRATGVDPARTLHEG